MKTVLTFMFAFVLVNSAFASNDSSVKHNNKKSEIHEQVSPLKVDTILDYGIVITSTTIEVKNASQKSIARLYKFKNSKIKRALTFTTKRDRAKLA